MATDSLGFNPKSTNLTKEVTAREPGQDQAEHYPAAGQNDRSPASGVLHRRILVRQAGYTAIVTWNFVQVNENLHGGRKMTKEEMLEYIRQNIEEADLETISYIYWLMIENE